MAIVKEYEQTLQLYQNYFGELFCHLVQQKSSVVSSEQQRQQETSFIYQLVHFQQPRVSKLINDTEIQQTLQHQLNQRKRVSKIQKTMKTGVLECPQTAINTTLKQKLDLSYKKVLNCHNPTESSQWWKIDRKDVGNSRDINESSSLSEYNCRGTNLMRQQTIQELMKKDAKLEKQLAGHISKQLIKHYKGTAKFMKKMKQKLITAKLNRRRRRV